MKIDSIQHHRFAIVSIDSASNENNRGGTEAIARYLRYVSAGRQL